MDYLNFLEPLTLSNLLRTILDILIIAALIYLVLILVKETNAQRLLYGILVITALVFVARLLNLKLLNFLVDNLLTVVLVAIPVIFQPELRAGLERLGKGGFVGKFRGLKKPEFMQAIEDLTLTAELLSKQKIGAIIALERNDSLKSFAENGRLINAELSFELLYSIFLPKSLLHDGAAIVSGNRLVAASVTLPVFQGVLDFNLGTRHKAALALSQQTDAIAIVVSEEKGTISLTYDGKLKFDITSEELRRALLRLLQK
jgi:diadenylate cyclase